MHLSIQRFSFLLVLAMLVIEAAVFHQIYRDSQSMMAEYLLEDIRKSLSEMSYALSKEVQCSGNAKTFVSRLQRHAASNDLIAAFVLARDGRIVLTTDPRYHTIPPPKQTCGNLQQADFKTLLGMSAYESRIRYYEQKELRYLTLYLYVDQRTLDRNLRENLNRYLMFFSVATLLLLSLFWILNRYFVVGPLEKLRQYAYYNAVIPKKMRVSEFEYIRASMVQTFQRLEHEKRELYRLARTDTLSGLGNRNYLDERVRWLIAEISREGGEFALLFLDLDHFKSINDSLGHKIGDELLVDIAKKLSQMVRANDIVTRIGGDEFVIVLYHYRSAFELTLILERIIDTLNAEWVVQGHGLHASGSIGVAFYPQNGQDLTTLLKHADIAMYEAKRRGRNQFYLFNDMLNEKIQSDIRLTKEMKYSLDAGDFVLHYQPKIDTRRRCIYEVEALIRWHHPRLGPVSPDDFIPLSEQNGFITELGMWVLKEALMQQRRWREEGAGDFRVSVNLSPNQLKDERFLEKFQSMLEETGAGAEKLDLEITESVFVENSSRNWRIMNALHQSGATISLDDFGTGYSSLSFLKRFPVDTIKIDRSFMQDYQSASGSVFIETIVKIGQTLHMEVLAEGVEEQAQLDYLAGIGCTRYQGYFCTRPLAADAFAQFVCDLPEGIFG